MPIFDIEAVARVCHEANRAYCLALGDTSQSRWEDAATWQRDSARHGVFLLAKNASAGPELLHEEWMREKLGEGWKLGPIKDVKAKTHPCLVPWAELPEDQRRKDRLFRAVALAVMGVEP